MRQPVTILDGGMGRELMRIGAPFRQPEWSALALLEGPDWVVRAHTNFIDSGAEVITTNTYAIVPFHIGRERFDEQAKSLATLAGRLARQAAMSASRPVRVAGSLPPLFGSYRPDLFDPTEAPSIIDPLVAGLSEYVDLWLGETLGSIAEAVAVRAALGRAGAQEQALWISYTLDGHDGVRLRSGESIADAVGAAVDLGASAVLFNCCEAETIGEAIDIAIGIVPKSVQVGGYANRFVVSHTDDGEANEQISRFRDDLDPTSYGEMVSTWIAQGASIVGGCCGMGPDHIAELTRLVEQARS